MGVYPDVSLKLARERRQEARSLLAVGADHMTGYGFRSVASTLLNEQGYRHDVIERQLAHAERNAVRAAYNRAEYLPERKKMMQEWTDYLDKIKARAEVIPLHGQAE